jgi:methionyl-tRNA formyltransferase
MKTIGAALLVKTIAGLVEGSIAEKKQDQPSDASQLKHAPKIFTETCQVNWQKPVHEIHNFIRGLSPFPGALSTLDGKILKIYRSQLEITTETQTCGTVLTDGKTFLKIAATDGFIHLLDLQLEGKKRMLVADFLRGYRINSI